MPRTERHGAASSAVARTLFASATSLMWLLALVVPLAAVSAPREAADTRARTISSPRKALRASRPRDLRIIAESGSLAGKTLYTGSHASSA